jgi:hypothetical protein
MLQPSLTTLNLFIHIFLPVTQCFIKSACFRYFFKKRIRTSVIMSLFYWRFHFSLHLCLQLVWSCCIEVSFMLSLPSIMQHTFYFRWHETYIHLTKMSLKYILFLATYFGHTGHLQAAHFDGTYCTVLAYVSSTRCCMSSLFSIWECLFSFIFILRRLRGPLYVPLRWSCVPCTDLVFLWCHLKQKGCCIVDRRESTNYAHGFVHLACLENMLLFCDYRSGKANMLKQRGRSLC